MSNKIYLERVSQSAKMPTKGSTHAACFDLYADLESRTVTKRTEVNEEVKVHTILEGDYITLQPKERVLIPTGWKMQCPEDMSIDFVPRSGIAWKEGVSVINTHLFEEVWPCKVNGVELDRMSSDNTIESIEFSVGTADKY